MTDSERRHKKTDLVLSNGEYAFTQDTTTGSVKVLTGPTVLNITGQEYPVVYEVEQRRFRAEELDAAARKCPMAPQGHYIVLWNPPTSGGQPNEGSKESAPSLAIGHRINIPGPATFSLWPQQVAEVIEGHHLRSNQYLLARVYDQEAAKANWKKAVLEVSASASDDGGEVEGTGTISELSVEGLTVGKLFVVKGTEVSFYIPPTGVEVVPDDDGRYVRDALTLERLQYCILVDENGDKDYQRGPQVVFPRPTQHFFRDGRGGIVFRPTELNPLQGIHVKVIAAYEEDGRTYHEGEELFVTGEQRSIYFPRPEHSLITYDGSAKHFATAIPEGQARYVMDRLTGHIRTVRGPTMLLCDPRREVLVRRVLSQRDCALYYPKNADALAHNLELEQLLARKPSTRAAVSEGEVRRNKQRRSAKRGGAGPGDTSSVHSDQSGAVADEWQRGANYEAPRSQIVDGRYLGAPVISVWNGYAIAVRNERGERRVEVGPCNVILEYDERLEILDEGEAADAKQGVDGESVYLRLSGKRVRDRVTVQTSDGVELSLLLRYAVEFVGDEALRFFAVPDHVARIRERTRKLLVRGVRQSGFEAFMSDPATSIAGMVLGDEGSSTFGECDMVVAGVELVDVQIADDDIARIHYAARIDGVTARVKLQQLDASMAVERQREALERQRAREKAETEELMAELQARSVAREAELAKARMEVSMAQAEKELELQRANESVANERMDQSLARKRKVGEHEDLRQRSRLEFDRERSVLDTQATVARFEAAQGPLAAAISRLGDQEVLVKVAEATSAQRLIGGKSVADVVGRLFAGTSLEPVFGRLQDAAGDDDDSR